MIFRRYQGAIRLQVQERVAQEQWLNNPQQAVTNRPAELELAALVQTQSFCP